MKISKWLVAYYLRQITVSWFARETMPPAELDGYALLLDGLVAQAESNGEVEPLRRGIETILAHPEIEAAPLASVVFPYREEQARDLLRYILAALPPPDPSQGAEASGEAELVATPLAEWRAARADTSRGSQAKPA
jgi:hypothetical protein